MECSSFACFWSHCQAWTITWLSTGALYFVCGCWALIELIHVYISIRRIQSSAINRQETTTATTFNNSTYYTADGSSSIRTPFNAILHDTPSSSSFLASSPVAAMQSNPSHTSQQSELEKMRMFETRLSQKIFLFTIFVEAMSRSCLFTSSPFVMTHCEMSKIDKPNLWYAIVGELAPNLFCFAFSCLGYAMSKIYFSMTNPKQYQNARRVRSIKRSFMFVACLCGIIAIQTIVVIICFVLFFQDENTYSHLMNTVDFITFYSYSLYCIVLGLYFFRFAFPIYYTYKRVVCKLRAYSQQNMSQPDVEESVFESSLSVSTRSVEDNLKREHRKKNKASTYAAGAKIEVHLHGNALHYFVSSMKRTWLMALYCGVAFLMRALVIFVMSDDLEQQYYILGPYIVVFEIVPNLLMLYIYHFSTKHMTQRYCGAAARIMAQQ